MRECILPKANVGAGTELLKEQRYENFIQMLPKIAVALKAHPYRSIKITYCIQELDFVVTGYDEDKNVMFCRGLWQFCEVLMDDEIAELISC